MTKRKLNPKVKQLVKTGKELFWKYGIKRVTVEEVCEEAKVSKMTFYKYFENKMDFVKFILEHVIDESMREYHDIMKMDIPFKEKVEKTLDLKLKGTTGISEEFYNDYIGNASPDMVQFIHQQMNKSIGLIMKDYIQAQKQGHIRSDIKPEFIIYFLNHIFDMMKDPKLEAMYSNTQDLIMETTNFFFYGILQRDN